jgi:hypothetical protein
MRADVDRVFLIDTAERLALFASVSSDIGRAGRVATWESKVGDVLAVEVDFAPGPVVGDGGDAGT